MKYMKTRTAAPNDSLPVFGQHQFSIEATAVSQWSEWPHWPTPGAQQLETAGKGQSGFLITWHMYDPVLDSLCPL